MGVYIYTARKGNPIQARCGEDRETIYRMVYDLKPWWGDKKSDRRVRLIHGRAGRAWPEDLNEVLVVECNEPDGPVYDGAPVYRRTGSPVWYDCYTLGEFVGRLTYRDGEPVLEVPDETA